MLDSSEPSPPEFSLSRFQFSLRAQMILVTAIAVVLGLFVIGGWPVVWVLLHGVVFYLVPTPLVIIALFGRGELRTFSIGALIPWVSVWSQSSPLFMMMYNSGAVGARMFAWMIGTTVFMFIAGAACGALAVLTMRWIVRTGGKAAAAPTPASRSAYPD